MKYPKKKNKKIFVSNQIYFLEKKKKKLLKKLFFTDRTQVDKKGQYVRPFLSSLLLYLQ